jgi:hypothetical protein
MLTLQEYIEEMGLLLDDTDYHQMGLDLKRPITKAYRSKRWGDVCVIQAGDTLLIDTSTQSIVESIDLLLDENWLADLISVSLEDLEEHTLRVGSKPTLGSEY